MISSLSPPSPIHFIAICGTGMGSLAGLFKQKGFKVTGSDQNVYPPMSSELKALGVKLYQGFGPQNLKNKPELVIIGNAISKNNTEVEEVIKLGIPYLSMPQALSQFFLEGHESIVVAGTHGKTTTTALLAHCLTELKANPGYLIGGILQGGQKNYQEASGKYFVIEGDEYDTAFFDKGPKFLHYQPFHTLITSLEFDHADIYRDLDHLTQSFEALIQKINPKGQLLVCSHYDRLVEISKQAKVPVETYGIKADPTWHAVGAGSSNSYGCFDIYYKNQFITQVRTTMSGNHNTQNILGTFALLYNLGFKPSQIAQALSTFQGVKRRQEVRGEIGGITVIDDFAHHPTAVLETILAIKQRYPSSTLWAVFEPRSNTSKRAIFQKDYAQAFKKADRVLLADVFMPEKVTDGAVLDVDQLIDDIQKDGPPAHHIGCVDEIVKYLTSQAAPPAVILIMSNGGFGGIHEKLLKALQTKNSS